MKSEHKNISASFQQHQNSFENRKEKIASISFSRINWSDSYLDFTPYLSAINQLKAPKLFKEEKPSLIKNHFVDDQLVYSFRVENENWGSVFIDYESDTTKWLLFSENFDGEMVLQQLKTAYHQDGKVMKVVSYLLDNDDDEETMMVDTFQYNDDHKVESIIRNGFYETKSCVLPERILSFEYADDKVSIYSTQESVNNKKVLVYEGKEM